MHHSKSSKATMLLFIYTQTHTHAQKRKVTLAKEKKNIGNLINYEIKIEANITNRNKHVHKKKTFFVRRGTAEVEYIKKDRGTNEGEMMMKLNILV